MRNLTYFEAYEKARDDIELARTTRGNSYGIAVDNDEFARQFRTRTRLARKLKYRIRTILGATPIGYCPICGFRVWNDGCSIGCAGEVGIPRPFVSEELQHPQEN